MHYKDLLSIFIIIFLISLGAHFTIYLGEIPITGQTLALLVSAFFVNWKVMFLSISGYLLLGAIGLPIYANGSSGWNKLIGPSIGYFIGFLIAGSLVSYLNEKLKISIIKIFSLHLLGTLLILAIGFIGLAIIFNIETASIHGLNKLWKGASVKIILGTIITYLLLRITTSLNKGQKKEDLK